MAEEENDEKVAQDNQDLNESDDEILSASSSVSSENNISEGEEEEEKQRNENTMMNKMILLKKIDISDKPEYTKLLLSLLEKLPDSNEYYSKIEKDKKNKINPRIPGIFVMFDNIDFYFNHFQKFQFFENYTTSIPKSINDIEEPQKIYDSIEDYIKENTSLKALLSSNKISINDIIYDYILYFVSKRDKLVKDSCDIKFIYKILFNLIEIKRKNDNLEGYKYLINIIILFNCYGSHITYPLNAIKYLKDEKIIDDIYTKIVKEIAKYEKESNIVLIIIESFFNVLINEILLNNEIISKLDYIHLFLMNIINTLNLPNKSFYIYMQFKALYNLIKEEGNNSSKKLYSEIYEIKDAFNDLNKKEKALNSYKEFFKKMREDFRGSYSYLRNFIVDYFYYELKKYQENEELFPIILEVLSEDYGSALTCSNKIFNIFLKKYIFESPPKNEEECKKILENAYEVKKEDNKNIKEDEINEDKDENNEIVEEPKIELENGYKDDLFLKKYNELKDNKKIKEIIDEIVQQVFGFYFNGYFMSNLDEINETYSFKNSKISRVFDNNILFLKICINYLEGIEYPFNGKEISIFLANAFIQSFLNIFIKYFYKNINYDKEYKGNYDISKVFDIIKGKSKFRRVIQIYVFRLIYNNINDGEDNKSFEKFKKFEVKNDAYQEFVEQFKEKYSFDDPPFTLIFYCKKIFEDFFYNDTQSLPINYKLRGYDFENGFPYDNNIINVKMVNNNEFKSTQSINSYENNSQFISRLAVLIISNASKDLINDEAQYKEINDDIKNIFRKKNKSIITVLNDALLELNGDLHLNLINGFKNLLSKLSDNDKDSDDDEKEMKNEGNDYIPKINYKKFLSKNNELNKYNQRVLGIFLYALKISLTNFIFDEREKCFYSYIIMTENSSKEILDILENSYIPGFSYNKKGLKDQKNDKDYYFGRWDSGSISDLTLRFILYSNLLFNLLTKKLNESDINNYTIKDGYSCLRTIVCIWTAIEKKLIKDEKPIIEIYFNLIIKYLPYILKQCTLDTVKEGRKTENFIDKFKEFTGACLRNYKEFSLNFIDTRMKFIIEELNNPLKYDFEEFPFLTYYSIQSKPNRDKIINKIDNNNNYLILNNYFDKMNSNCLGIKDINLLNLGKYFTNSINNKLIIMIDKLEQYKKLYDLFKSHLGDKIKYDFDFFCPIESIKINKGLMSEDELEKTISNSINEINGIVDKLINDKIKYDSTYKYLFNEIYEEKEFLQTDDLGLISMNLSEISKYKHYANFLGEYMYRNNFKSDYSIDYFDYKKFSMNLKEVDEHLFSILLFNKKIFLDVDYSRKVFYPKFNRFNMFSKKSHNQDFLKKYLQEYPMKEELSSEQIKSINNSIDKIIHNLGISEYKNNLENKIKNEMDELQKKMERKKKKIEEEMNKIEPNSQNNDTDFIKYEKLLNIKNIDKKIDKKESLINILNYKYEEALASIKIKFLIEICFSLQNLLYYIYPLKINEEIPLLYICNNLQLFKFEKEKLLYIFEQNENLKLSHLFSLYEYFESLIFPYFLYQINKNYMTQIPLYLAKKIIYIFENEEIKNNINFTKIELIEVLRKCLCRYIVSSKIEENFIVEELNEDLFDLIVKEDLWNKNLDIIKIKESFNFINDYMKYPLKVKHIFNLFEILIGIESKNYLCSHDFDNEEENEENFDEVIFKEEKKDEDKEKEKEQTNIEEQKEKEKDSDNSDTEDILEPPKKEINLLKKWQKYIYDSIKNSELIEKYIESVKTKDNNNQKIESNLKDILIDVMNFSLLFKSEILIKKLVHYIRNPKIKMDITKLKEKKDILNIGDNITNIILFNKNKIIISYTNKIIKFYSFDRKTFRKDSTFNPLDIKNLKGIKNIDSIHCMKELNDGTLLLGTDNGYIMNLMINELKKKNLSEYTVQLLNEIYFKDLKTIKEFIEINNKMFISNDRDDKNILWQDFKLKKELNKGKISKVKNNLIILNGDSVFFYDIKKDFEESGKIDIKLINHTILNDSYLVAEDRDSWKVHLVNLEEKKEIQKKEYKPNKSFILEKICNEWAFKLEKDIKTKLVTIKLIKNNNGYDIFADNKKSLIIESGSYYTNLFDEIFIYRNKRGNINCYGHF